LLLEYIIDCVYSSSFYTICWTDDEGNVSNALIEFCLV